MTRRCAFLIFAGAAGAAAQGKPIDSFEVRGTRLYLRIGGEDLIVSVSALRAWPGWTPYTLLYSEKINGKQRLRWYDAFTRQSQTITTEDLDITDTTTVRLSSGNYAILIAMRRQPEKMPWFALATTAGVFYREANAMYGTAANDVVQVRRYAIGELERVHGNLDLVQPVAVVNMPLAPGSLNAAGVYELTLPAADASERRLTLNLRPDGTATLITAFAGKGAPTAQRGRWKQEGTDVRLELESPDEVLTWTATIDGLVPKEWERNRYGSIGLPFRRPETPGSAPRRAPGTLAPRR